MLPDGTLPKAEQLKAEIDEYKQSKTLNYDNRDKAKAELLKYEVLIGYLNRYHIIPDYYTHSRTVGDNVIFTQGIQQNVIRQACFLGNCAGREETVYVFEFNIPVSDSVHI